MRLAPLPADQWDDTARTALSAMRDADTNNALSTLARHPALAKAFLRFNVHLLTSSTLPPRVRELAILRVAHRRTCAYEWSHHVSMAKAEGITEDQIAAVQSFAGEDAGGLDEFDRVVIAGVDELEEKSQLSDETWAALGERLDDQQRMDFVFTVGCYALLAMAFNTFGVQLENADEEH
ncbi:carboxymuconolactone decarboxylase family protein [Mycobacterium paraseoulense]|uniref:Carboxymuconolactone decarboxylase n=1 Tax=Mycobacterium paraseoulense TaxID=590652 RepID=A0A1X0IGL8_9MYCO|nr:carboxymuconolactone decarboxylase family protein [Mycobacterium paraseoulense]MCV7395565.1 carboxymuconolactone decarboxylase family protein [Mycobacterium paraseoulense]ORB46151.1 carboxymuconolactone decarboxylase [Mycobacterium paraseoulense]BBZ71957.1 carboxymuconolactone decarboxylase [Mycobacterium paraseoulense]